MEEGDGMTPLTAALLKGRWTATDIHSGPALTFFGPRRVLASFVNVHTVHSVCHIANQVLYDITLICGSNALLD